ncbi:XRE family transcriptional regulator [Fructilactobacillus frigidiflavus]|uniref:XRE family transcriptional regulator n=1 Tax=Fructilactobacillus frigidiflavus TaxID=3242688 RepID=UPI0037564A9E
MQNQLRKQIIKLRQAQNLSQEMLANKMFVSRQSVSKWEKGDSVPDLDKLLSLAQIFNVDLNELVTGNETAQENLLTLTHVKKQFDNPVLKDINLIVANNERIAFLGSNGAGKTTLVKLISGALKPTSGVIKRNYDKSNDFGLMPQENTLIESFRVLEMIELTISLNKLPKIKIDELLTEFGLLKSKSMFVSSLSGGQKRKLALLISSIKPSKLLILDEPTVGMDLETIDFFWKYMDQIQGTVITITHDFNQIDHYFDRVILLKNGEISCDEKVATIHSHNQNIDQWYRQHNREVQ